MTEHKPKPSRPLKDTPLSVILNELRARGVTCLMLEPNPQPESGDTIR